MFTSDFAQKGNYFISHVLPVAIGCEVPIPIYICTRTFVIQKYEFPVSTRIACCSEVVLT